MYVICLIVSILFAAILGDPSLAQDTAQVSSGSNPTHSQPDNQRQSDLRSKFDVRHRRISTVIELNKLSQTKQADEQKLSATRGQENLPQLNLDTLGDLPINRWVVSIKAWINE